MVRISQDKPTLSSCSEPQVPLGSVLPDSLPWHRPLPPPSFLYVYFLLHGLVFTQTRNFAHAQDACCFSAFGASLSMLSGAPWLGAGGDRSSMGGLVPLLFLASFLAHPMEVAGVFPTGMLEFKSTKGHTYCAAAVRKHS